MERRRFLKTAAAAPLVAGALAAPAIAQGTFRWRMANLYPRGISFGVAYQSFTDRVASASGGRLVIDNVYDGEGVSATEVLSAVKSGLVEMGSPYMALHAGELAAGVVELGLPGGPGRYDQLYAMWAAGGWKEILIDTYASQGMRHLGSVLQPGVYILTKAPVNTLADLKGMKLRAPGAYGAFMRELGVAPVSMAFAEVYTSLATGVIDGCCSSNLVDYRDGKWYEQAKYLYPVAVSGAQASPTVVNQASFDSLPDDLKSILEVANVEHVFAHATLATTTVADAVAEMKAGGASFTALPSDADTATWRAAATKVGAEYAAADPFSRRLVEAQEAFLAKLGG